MMRCRIAANLISFFDNMYAVVLGDSQVRLWGLTPAERIERQLRAEGIALRRDGIGALRADESVLVLRGDCLYDGRVIRGLAQTPGTLLEGDADGRRMPLAAHVLAEQASAAESWLHGGARPGALADSATVNIDQVAKGYEAGLKKLDRPFVLPVTAERRAALEQLTFAGAYKGVTDLVTKWVWPVPAQWVTRACVRLRMTPNQVTAASLVLVIAAGALFARGEFAWGLLAGWIMTFLDTVDGKLARVTVTSTKLGNIFDHGIDLVHPPFWYLAWGVGLALSPPAIGEVPLVTIYWVILAGYVGGRLCEGAFQLWIARFSIFTWRPFDSWFRLIAARRNPNMIMLTASLVAGRPELGLMAVAAWTSLSTALLLVRLLLAARAKRGPNPVTSWLSEIGQTVDERSLAVRVFSHAAPAARKA
jgi:phosphatidylglycerophosphate synthase